MARLCLYSCLALSFLLAACDDGPECTYDAGYGAGYDGALPQCEASQYVEGYAEGEFESHCDWLKCEERDRDEFGGQRCGSWSERRCY